MARIRMAALLLLTSLIISPASTAVRPDVCYGRLPPEPPIAGLGPPITPPLAGDWTWAATVLQPWGPTQYELVHNATRLAPLLMATYGFNALILLPAPAHLSYCPTGSSCALTAAEIAAGVATFRAAGWRVILYTSFMHCGEARVWTNGSLNAAYPGWAQRNDSGAAWRFEGGNSPLSPCSEPVLEYTTAYAAQQAQALGSIDATMLDNNEMGPLAWGCANSGCGYEPPCAAAFDVYARARFNASTLRDCFDVNNSALDLGGRIQPPPRSQLGQPLYGLWVHWRNVAMASLNRRFAAELRRGGVQRLLANTAVDWPDFSLAQDLQYQAEDVVLSEVYTTDPASLHQTLALGLAVAQGRPFWAALYANQMKAVELPPPLIGRLLTTSAAHQARPWLVFESVLLTPFTSGGSGDPRAQALQQVQNWLASEDVLLRGGDSIAPVACMASAATRNSAWHQQSLGTAIVPSRCLRTARDLGAPVRVVFDGDYRAEWLNGVRLLVLDGVHCLPEGTVPRIASWVAGGGTLLVSEDSGFCDGLGRRLPNRYTLIARLGAAATIANISSSIAASLIRAHAWTVIPDSGNYGIILPYGHTNHLTIFMLCAVADGCPEPGNRGISSLIIPLNVSQQRRGALSARLSAVGATRPLAFTASKDWIRVQVNTTGIVSEDIAVIVTLSAG